MQDRGRTAATIEVEGTLAVKDMDALFKDLSVGMQTVGDFQGYRIDSRRLVEPGGILFF